MAKSSGAYGFTYKRNLQPGQKPAVLEVIFSDDEQTFTIGDCVQWTNGYLTEAATTEWILGVLVGIVTEKGENLFKTKEAHDGTISGDETFTPASDNTTDKKVKGVVIVDKDAVFLGQADSTLTQAEVGEYFDLTAAPDRVTSTGSTTQAQRQLIELVTEDESGTAQTGYGLFRICESQLFNGIPA